jgi:hypothetical protein
MAKLSAAKTDISTTDQTAEPSTDNQGQPAMSFEPLTDNQGQPAMSYEELAKKLEQPPENYQNQGGDAKAFWDPDLCAVLCIPKTAKLFDGNQDPKKPSMLIIAQLCARLPMRLAKEKDAPPDSKGEVIVCNPGDMIGIWGKPGMRDIRDLAGVKTWIKKTDKRLDVGKGKPMVVYDVRAPERGERIPVVEDVRNKSAGVSTFLDVKVRPKADTGHSPKAGEDDDIPF